MDGFFPDRAKKEGMRHRRVLEHLRKDWYGKSRGILENRAHDPMLKIGDLAEETLANACPDDETKDFAELNARFDAIAQDWSAMVRLQSLQAGVLTLKLRHRAYRERMEEEKELILDAVNSVFGRPVCRTLEIC